MEIEDFAKTSKIPIDLLKKITRSGMVETPLSENDIKGLEFLEKIWGDAVICQALLYKRLVKKSKKAREAYLNTFDLETKWERYAFSRFYNYDPKDHGGRKLRLSAVINDLKEFLNFDPNYFQIRRLYAVRQKVYHLRMKSKREGQLSSK